MSEFSIAYISTAKVEGGYVNDPNDKGGETYKGISRKMNPDWKGWILIDEFKKTHTLKRNDIIDSNTLDLLVTSFYKHKYWDINNLSLIDEQLIANELYDTGVNMGTGVAAKFLQEALNYLNNNQKSFNDIAEDGKIGMQTITLVNAYPRQAEILKVLNGLQFGRYINICQKDPSQEANFRGWLSRC
jgi:lysozyme family protein